MKKRMMILVVAVVMVVALSAVAYAAETGSYYFTFTPPLAGSARHTDYIESDGGMSPWVHQNYNSAPTSYWFYYYSGGSYYMATPMQWYVTTPGTYSLTYNTGYGGAGQKMYLYGCSSYGDFDQYSVSGTWSPD